MLASWSSATFVVGPTWPGTVQLAANVAKKVTWLKNVRILPKLGALPQLPLLVNRLCPRLVFRLLFLVLLSTWVCPPLSRQFPHVTGLVSSLLFSFARLYFLLTMALSIIPKRVWSSGPGERSGLRQWISSLPRTVDIVCLQEAHVVSQAEVSLWSSSAGFTVASSPGTNRSCGVIVLARPSCLMVNS